MIIKIREYINVPASYDFMIPAFVS